MIHPPDNQHRTRSMRESFVYAETVVKMCANLRSCMRFGSAAVRTDILSGCNQTACAPHANVTDLCALSSVWRPYINHSTSQ